MFTQHNVLYIKFLSFFIYSRTGVLYVNVFKYSLRNMKGSDTALKITTDFSDDIHYLHACHLKFTVCIVYIPVETTFSKSTMCPNHHGQYFYSLSTAAFIVF